MIVDDVDIKRFADDSVELSASVTTKWLTEPFPLSFRFRGVDPDDVTATGDTFLSSLLLTAMTAGEDLRIKASCSERLLNSVNDLVALHSAWFPGAERIEVDVAGSERRSAGRGETGLFFSTGVDSFYSLFKDDEAAISSLIYLEGYNLPHDMPSPEVLAGVKRVARESGRNLVVVRTNVRPLTFRLVRADNHGGVFAGVGQALGGRFGTCLIPSGRPAVRLRPHGTHPELDPLWSTEAVEFVHDGAEAPRTEKICNWIAQSNLALETLHVCWTPAPGTLNCGRCTKCIVTMLALHVAGVLDRATTFPPLEPRYVRSVVVGHHRGNFVQDVLPGLKRTPGGARLRLALRQALVLDRCASVSKRVSRWSPGLSKFASRLVHRLGLRYPDVGRRASRKQGSKTSPRLR